MHLHVEKCVSYLPRFGGFLPGTLAFSANKTDRNDMAKDEATAGIQKITRRYVCPQLGASEHGPIILTL